MAACASTLKELVGAVRVLARDGLDEQLAETERLARQLQVFFVFVLCFFFFFFDVFSVKQKESMCESWSVVGKVGDHISPERIV